MTETARPLRVDQIALLLANHRIEGFGFGPSFNCDVFWMFKNTVQTSQLKDVVEDCIYNFQKNNKQTICVESCRMSRMCFIVISHWWPTCNIMNRKFQTVWRLTRHADLTPKRTAEDNTSSAACRSHVFFCLYISGSGWWFQTIWNRLLSNQLLSSEFEDGRNLFDTNNQVCLLLSGFKLFGVKQPINSFYP